MAEPTGPEHDRLPKDEPGSSGHAASQRLPGSADDRAGAGATAVWGLVVWGAMVVGASVTAVCSETEPARASYQRAAKINKLKADS